jgi:hypothetical protein
MRLSGRVPALVSRNAVCLEFVCHADLSWTMLYTPNNRDVHLATARCSRTRR